MSGSLETNGRMAQVLVSVKDPMSLLPEHAGKPRLLVGMYVRAVCEGVRLNDVFKIPEGALRDGSCVWIMTKENKLEIRPVNVLWRDTSSVFIGSGLRSGERLVTSNLATPVEGVALRIDNGTKDRPVQEVSHE